MMRHNETGMRGRACRMSHVACREWSAERRVRREVQALDPPPSARTHTHTAVSTTYAVEILPTRSTWHGGAGAPGRMLVTHIRHQPHVPDTSSSIIPPGWVIQHDIPTEVFGRGCLEVRAGYFTH
jgi:hypothetical protein